MQVLLIAGLSAVAFIVAYNTYGRWLGSRIFRLSARTVCPAVELRDDQDYVPSPKWVVFGHHFTSIAGTGPIVGPAIAIVWGWVPALLWVVFGSIFIGAVHDLGSLVVSLRNKGRTVGDIAGDVIAPRLRVLFLGVLFMALTIVLAIFGMVIAAVLRQFPSAIFPVVAQVPLAIALGLWIRHGGRGLGWLSLVALLLMYASVIWAETGLLQAFNMWLASWNTATWVLILLGYSYVASVLPVWLLLQPRDYINALQLLSIMGLLVAGLVAAALLGGVSATPDLARPALEMAAPAWNLHPEGAPAIAPFLFITIACGAVSGFHCLVSSGTSSKQIAREPDARLIGYGAMLMEGFLAVLIIVCVGAALALGVRVDGQWLSGTEAWTARYPGWSQGLGGMLANVVDGAGNLLACLAIPREVGVTLMGVFVASFAGTTLDSACRLQRYVVQELLAALFAGGSVCHEKSSAVTFNSPRSMNSVRLSCWWSNKHSATLLAVALAAALASVPAPGQAWSWSEAGKGGLLLWPLFGATNQLLGGLAFLVIIFYLLRHGMRPWFLWVPALVMLVVPAWALFVQAFVGSGAQPSWLAQKNWLLVLMSTLTLALEGWMLFEAVKAYLAIRSQKHANSLSL